MNIHTFMNPIILADHNYSHLEKKLIKQAFILSRSIDDKNKSRHLSFIVMRNKIVSSGINDSYKTHTEAARWGHWHHSIHSELDAIVKFSGKNLSRHTMYNLRISRANQIVLSKPCKKCEAMLHYYGIECIYTNERGKFQRLLEA